MSWPEVRQANRSRDRQKMILALCAARSRRTCDLEFCFVSVSDVRCRNNEYNECKRSFSTKHTRASSPLGGGRLRQHAMLTLTHYPTCIAKWGVHIQLARSSLGKRSCHALCLHHILILILYLSTSMRIHVYLCVCVCPFTCTRAFVCKLHLYTMSP